MTFIRSLLAVGLLPGLLQAATIEEIRRDGVIQVCIWSENVGVTHRNPRSGAVEGLDIDMSRALASELGLRVEYIESEPDRVVEDIEAGRCDIAMMGLRVTPERSARVDFSRPYLRSDIVGVTTVANASVRSWEDIDKPGHVVSVQSGRLVELAMREALRLAELRSLKRLIDLERDVEAGRADVFMTDFIHSRAILVNADWARVVEPSAPVRPMDYAYALRRGDASWLEKVNAFLTRVKRNGMLEASARAHGLLPILVKD